jgi:Smg protein
MFDILVYLYENFGAFESCPDASALGRSLSDAGFEDEEIHAALSWLQDLAERVQEGGFESLDASQGRRVFSAPELSTLGPEPLGLLIGLEAAGQITPRQRELVLERAMACPETPLTVPTLKIIILMVLWSQSADIDILLLEDLLDDGDEPVMH